MSLITTTIQRLIFGCNLTCLGSDATVNLKAKTDKVKKGSTRFSYFKNMEMLLSHLAALYQL